MELKDTIEMMNSADHKERLKAEYYQVKIRAEKLNGMIIKYEAGTLGFTPDTPIAIFQDQLRIMREYITDLQIRAEIERIELK